MSQADGGVANGHHDDHAHASLAKAKGKQQKKPVDSGEASKLLAARISQLEQEHAGEKDQEAEIEREVKRATRELNQQISKLDPMEKKIDYLIKRCSELVADLRKVTRDNKNNKSRADNLQKDKDANRAELTRTAGLKDKLEKLCRELQRDNNKLKSDHKALQNSSIARQEAADHKFASLLAKLQGWQEDKDRPPQEAAATNMDEEFRQRFMMFVEQYELRELYFHSAMRTKELESHFHMSRYEKEKRNAETEAHKARNLQNQVHTFHKTETDLRQQLNVYIDKFKQVEDTLNNSNDLFLSFRKEMEDMSKKTKKLEKENETLKRKHDVTNANIVRMAEELEQARKKTEAAKQQEAMLRSIIQQMQQQGRRLPAEADPQLPEIQGPADEDSDYRDDDSTQDDEAAVQTQAQSGGVGVVGNETSEAVPYGPEPPPPPSSALPNALKAVTNGHRQPY